MFRRQITVLLVLAFLSAGVPPVSAQQTSGGGHVLLVPSPPTSTAMPDGRTVMYVHVDGFVTADEASNPFGPATQSCSGTVVAAPGGASAEGHGYCDGVDTDGDVWWIWWSETPAGGRWGIIAGTGKFQGMKGGGTTNRIAEWPDGRYMVRWEGSWSRN